MNDYREKTLQELAAKSGAVSSRFALVGFDGFVDRIVHPIDERQGPGDRFRRIDTMAAFAKRIEAAAGHSTNIEIHTLVEKIGGNGPIMANALLQTGMDVHYIGALGRPAVLPVFESFASGTRAISVGNPGVTHALEFQDGKVMLGTMESFDEIDFARILREGGEGVVTDLISRADMLAFVNWTMMPHMTGILHGILDRILPNLGPRDHRSFFVDLSDPEKRSDGDLLTVLRMLRRFALHGRMVLGLNLKEALRVDRVLGNAPGSTDPAGLRLIASRLRKQLDIHQVVIHPTDGAACATKTGDYYTPGPMVREPRITTGAGDHFNAGYMLGETLELSPESCLVLAVAFSGWYVSSGTSPSLLDVESFIRQWQADVSRFE